MVGEPGGESVSATWVDDPDSGGYVAELDGWVDAIAIDVRHGDDAVVIDHARAIDDPDEVSFDVPAEVSVQTRHDLHWNGQGRPVNAFVLVFSAPTGFTHLGSLATIDSGEYSLASSTVPFEGEYLVAMTRMVDYHTLPGESLFDAHGSVTFSSVSNRRVRAVPPPLK
jgi:hypothetical protein